MRHEVILVYKDQKSLKIMIKEENIKRFFEDLTDSQIYRQTDSESGFWTNLSDIRYILINEGSEFCVNICKEDGSSTEEVQELYPGIREGKEQD